MKSFWEMLRPIAAIGLERGRLLEFGKVIAGLLMGDQNEVEKTLQVSARGSASHQLN